MPSSHAFCCVYLRLFVFQWFWRSWRRPPPWITSNRRSATATRVCLSSAAGSQSCSPSFCSAALSSAASSPTSLTKNRSRRCRTRAKFRPRLTRNVCSHHYITQSVWRNCFWFVLVSLRPAGSESRLYHPGPGTNPRPATTERQAGNYARSDSRPGTMQSHHDYSMPRRGSHDSKQYDMHYDNGRHDHLYYDRSDSPRNIGYQPPRQSNLWCLSSLAPSHLVNILFQVLSINFSTIRVFYDCQITDSPSSFFICFQIEFILNVKMFWHPIHHAPVKNKHHRFLCEIFWSTLQRSNC